MNCYKIAGSLNHAMISAKPLRRRGSWSVLEPSRLSSSRVGAISERSSRVGIPGAMSERSGRVDIPLLALPLVKIIPERPEHFVDETRASVTKYSKYRYLSEGVNHRLSWSLYIGYIWIYFQHIFGMSLVYSNETWGTLKRPGCSSWWCPTLVGFIFYYE